MDNKFYDFLFCSAISLFFVLVLSCQSEAKSAEPLVEPNSTQIVSTPPKVESNSVQAVVAVPPEAVQTEVNKPPAYPPSAARIKFESIMHNFGQVEPDSINDCNFAFKNVGKDILHIDHAKGTCKCTVPELKKTDYAPGESGEISVEFHAPKYQGETAQRVIVYSNDSNSPQVQLEIKAYVKSDVQVTPEKMTLSLLSPNAGAGQITLAGIDGEKFAVKGVVSAGGVVSVNFDPNNISEKHILDPVVNIDNLRKYLNGYIIFTINHPKVTSVRVEYTCLKEFETSPAVIIVRDATIGEVQKRLVYLTSNYNQPIEIESVTSDSNAVKVVGQKKTDTRFEFDIEITPPEPKGKLRIFSDVLHIKLKGQQELTIPCRGFYKPDK